MLTFLGIQNYLTVDSLSLSFKNGMTAITGETGAGKSVLIGALTTSLGAPASTDLISKGKDKFDITTIFNIKNLLNVQEYLKEFEWYDGDELILRRIVSQDGKNKCFINSNICKVADLKKMADLLVTFHDQNQQHNLVKSKKQLNLLDDYCGNMNLLIEIKKVYNTLQNKKEKFYNLKNNFEETNALYQLLNYQIEEIEELDLKPNEFQELEEEYNKLSNSEEILGYLNNSKYLLDNDDENILSMLCKLQKNLDNIDSTDKALAEIKEMVESSYINLKESVSYIENYASSFEINPHRLQTVSDRIENIISIAKKHHITPEGISVLYRELTKKLEQMKVEDLDLDSIQEEIRNLSEQYLELAKSLRLSRIEGIPLLMAEINKELVSLKFNADIFSIEIESIYPEYPYDSEDQYTVNGIDRVEFYIQPNLGQDKQLLAKAASGGELSRISLVLELISSRKNSIPTMIFDEVDSGIGGETGDSVGALLSEIGNNNQLFVISHLPQVAAKAHNHITVKKNNKNNITQTLISDIDGNERVQEIARMLGGGKNISNESWHYARKLMNLE